MSYLRKNICISTFISIIMSTFRGFIAVEVPVNEKILNFLDELSKLPTNIKLVEPENIHITMKFLGETNQDHIDDIHQIMQSAIDNIQPWTIRLQGTGVFPNKNYIKIIWIGIEHIGPLSEISSFLNHACTDLGYKKEKRGFKAHLTIGRAKNAVGKDQLLAIIDRYHDTVFDDILIDRILLKKSTLTPTGPIYETLSTVRLS
jgi:RNA 2',3'-cyclic 3'-phosphodiesterase